jgi:teichuronic acid biosynthesis glycosyltransferase TuaG
VDEDDGMVKHNLNSSEHLVSIIMPAYNSARTIASSIDSVINQNFGDWELIIIDDHSQDDTVQIVKSYTNQDKRIKLIALPINQGLSSARNAGIEISRAKYITFLDADDSWHIRKLEAQIELHVQNPKIRISHTNYDFIINDQRVNREKVQFWDFFYVKRGNLYPQILYKNNLAILSVMVEREVILAAKGFDTSLWAFEDQDLWIKIAKQKIEFGYLDERLCFYRINPNGMSNNLGKYKRAYKFYLHKYQHDLKVMRCANQAKSVYLNYFGVQYYRRANFRLAFYYFFQAWKQKIPFLLKSIFLGYLFSSFIGMLGEKLRKK